MKTPEKFTKKESQINKAIEKVKNRLSLYSQESEKIKHNWTDQDRERFKDWNLLHDLQYRLENRLWDNYSNYQQWHFENFGWAAYDIKR